MLPGSVTSPHPLRLPFHNLGFVAQDGYNYDRLRDEGEGRDWEGFETEDRDDWED